MADCVSMADDGLPSVEEIPNMKVADLKKKLRALGLPIMGNKTELIERLQEACMSAKDSFESSHLSFDDSQLESENADGSAGEESALLEQEHYSSYVDSSLDETKVLVNSENKLNLSSNSPSITKPLKKRSLTTPVSESAVPEKKLVINRTNVAHTEITMKPDSNSKSETVASSDKSETGEKRVLSIKNMSAAERMALRAKRFNTSNVVGTTSITNSMSTGVNMRNSNRSIVSAPGNTDLEKLKKRAERFGQKVSNVLKQLEQKEKFIKRKSKFGVSLAAASDTSSSLDEQAKKKQRAERFGM